MNTKDKEVLRLLPVELTDEELVDLSARLAKATIKHNDLTEEKKKSNAQFTKDLNHHKAEMDHTALLVDEQTEEREVMVVVTIDYDNKRYMERRSDTHDITVDRDLLESEMQPDLPTEESTSEA